MKLAMNRISRQLIGLVFIALIIFSVGVAALVGWQSYGDLKEVAFERVQAAGNLFASEIENNISRTHNSIGDVESNRIITEQLVLLNNYGPLYAEDASQINQKILDSDATFYFQSQLQLARSLIHLLPSHQLSELTIYHTDTFDQHENSAPLPSVIIDHEFVWFFRYDKKSYEQTPRVYKLPIHRLNYDGDFFDISTVYQENSDFFYESMGVELTNEIPSDHFNQLSRPKNFTSGEVISLAQDRLQFITWTQIVIDLVHPDNWQITSQRAIIIVAVQEPDNDSLQTVADRLGAELAIVDSEHVWASSIDHNQQYHFSEHDLEVGNDPYIFSEVAVGLPSDDDKTFKVMALSPTVGLIKRTNSLIIRLTLVTLLAIIVTAASIYWMVQVNLRRPLDQLLHGVVSLRKGDMDVAVNITTNNELTTLGRAFNDMTQQLKEKSNALQKANDTLEHKVKERTEDLENAQQQLIIAEKMASLGQLVAGVAHEINTPLGNSITALSFNKTESEVLQKKFDNKTLTATDFGKFLNISHESISIMETNLRKARQLVQTFKNVAVNQSVEEVTAFSVYEHVDEVLVTLKPQLKQTQIKVHLDISPELIIESYSGAYYHIISNMIMNSIKHAFPDRHGNIYLSIKADEDNVYLEYKDDGKGMDEVTCSKIFDPFFTTKRGDGGTGLGMYMTYNIVTQQLGGIITASSEINKGTLFSVVVPLALPDSHESGQELSV